MDAHRIKELATVQANSEYLIAILDELAKDVLNEDVESVNLSIIAKLKEHREDGSNAKMISVEVPLRSTLSLIANIMDSAKRDRSELEVKIKEEARSGDE